MTEKRISLCSAGDGSHPRFGRAEVAMGGRNDDGTGQKEAWSIPSQCHIVIGTRPGKEAVHEAIL